MLYNPWIKEVLPDQPWASTQHAPTSHLTPSGEKIFFFLYFLFFFYFFFFSSFFFLLLLRMLLILLFLLLLRCLILLTLLLIPFLCFLLMLWKCACSLQAPNHKPWAKWTSLFKFGLWVESQCFCLFSRRCTFSEAAVLANTNLGGHLNCVNYKCTHIYSLLL